jgi:hypothetical protein
MLYTIVRTVYEKFCSKMSAYFKRHMTFRKAAKSLVCSERKHDSFFKPALLCSETKYNF